MEDSLHEWLEQHAHCVQFTNVDGINYFTKEAVLLIHDLLIESMPSLTTRYIAEYYQRAIWNSI